MNPMHNYYLDLLLRPGATPEAVRSAYRTITRLTHSDRHNGSETYRPQFEAAVEAWKVLGNPQIRSQYESQRAQWLSSVHSVECIGCGEALRLKQDSRQQRCPMCKMTVSSPIPSQQERENLLRETGVRLSTKMLEVSEEEAERLGREMLQRGAQLLGEVISDGFHYARSRLKPRKRP